jgi:hypothetical protein
MAKSTMGNFMAKRNATDRHLGAGTLFGKPRGDVVKHPGAFKAKAEESGESVAQKAKEVLKSGSKASAKTKKQAVLAETFAKIRSKK